MCVYIYIKLTISNKPSWFAVFPLYPLSSNNSIYYAKNLKSLQANGGIYQIIISFPSGGVFTQVHFSLIFEFLVR